MVTLKQRHLSTQTATTASTSFLFELLTTLYLESILLDFLKLDWDLVVFPCDGLRLIGMIYRLQGRLIRIFASFDQSVSHIKARTYDFRIHYSCFRQTVRVPAIGGISCLLQQAREKGPILLLTVVSGAF